MHVPELVDIGCQPAETRARANRASQKLEGVIKPQALLTIKMIVVISASSHTFQIVLPHSRTIRVQLANLQSFKKLQNPKTKFPIKYEIYLIYLNIKMN